MKDLVIGVLGGMGTYATINLFKQYAEVFPAEKEWERPRIIIDNRCTMPSRVRAFLYHENVERLIDEMADSIDGLLKIGGGSARIILACNTSHLFLPQIYKKVPEAKSAVINIIHSCVEQISKDNVKQVFLLGSEGTIESKVYQEALSEKGIICKVPQKEQYVLLRNCVEAVKQNKYSDEVKKSFQELMDEYDVPIILGCTELPILYEKYKDGIDVTVYDPLLIALKKLKEECENE